MGNYRMVGGMENASPEALKREARAIALVGIKTCRAAVGSTYRMITIRELVRVALGGSACALPVWAIRASGRNRLGYDDLDAFRTLSASRERINLRKEIAALSGR